MTYTPESIAEVCGKIVKSITNFPAGKDAFDAYNAACETVKKLGFDKGSMCRDLPIALCKNYDYIAKWHNIDRDEYSKIEGVLLSNDFRDGNVQLVIFA